MITTPTIFVLGAGASVDYGFPTGEALGNVMAGHRKLYPLWINGFGQRLQVAGDLLGTLPRDPLVLEVRAFQKRFRDSGLQPVDRFAERLAKLADKRSKDLLLMWQLLVAHEILWCEQRLVDWFSRDVFREKDQDSYLDSAIKEDRRPWFSALFSRMEAGVENSAHFFKNNNVWFWTFNYDRLLEHLFHSALTASFGILSASGQNLLRELRLVHVHGQVGDYGPPMARGDRSGCPNSMVPFGSTLARDIEVAAEGIVQAHAPFDNQVMKSVMRNPDGDGPAHSEVRVVFLGFGFDVKNLEKLGLRRAMMQHHGWSKVTCYAVLKGGLSPRLSPIMEDLKIPNDRVYSDIRTLLEAMPD